MKKLTSILLLISLTLPFIGSVSWLNYQKKKVKRQVKHQIIAGINKSELVLLIFSKEDLNTKLNWKHSKEFEFNNNMYDIVEADTTNNIVSYWCWWDSEETKLNKQLTKLLAQFLGKDHQNKETKSQLSNFLDALFYLKNEPWKASVNSAQKKHLYTYNINYESLKISPSTPPPIHS